MSSCTFSSLGSPLWMQLHLPFSLFSSHCWAIHLQTHSFPPSHTFAFYFKMGTPDSRLSVFRSHAQWLQTNCAATRKGGMEGERKEGRKKAGQLFVYTGSHPQSTGVLRPDLKNSGSARRNKGLMVHSASFIVGLFPLDGHIHHLPW